VTEVVGVFVRFRAPLHWRMEIATEAETGYDILMDQVLKWMDLRRTFSRQVIQTD
jgi:hypothetical protein